MSLLTLFLETILSGSLVFSFLSLVFSFLSFSLFVFSLSLCFSLSLSMCVCVCVFLSCALDSVSLFIGVPHFSCLSAHLRALFIFSSSSFPVVCVCQGGCLPLLLCGCTRRLSRLPPTGLGGTQAECALWVGWLGVLVHFPPFLAHSPTHSLSLSHLLSLSLSLTLSSLFFGCPPPLLSHYRKGLRKRNSSPVLRKSCATFSLCS
jgi:hypothetical protein